MLRRLTLLVGVTLVALVALYWVPPLVAGPTVDCTQLVEGECDEAVALAIEQATAYHDPPIPMPVTSVSVQGSTLCLSYQVAWLFWFGVVAYSLC